MTIKTRVLFYYIDPITKDNNVINFREPNNAPALELTSVLNVGSRSMEKFIDEVQRGLNSVGQETYTLTLDRETRLVTITCTDTFELLVSSGSNIGTSVYSLLGFNGVDRTGSTSYVSDTPIGSSYSPQFPPQSFTSFDDNERGIQSSINESANGTVEVVTFGSKKLMDMEIMYITERFRGKDSFIENNANALSEARQFMNFLITKSNLEIMLDRDDRATFIEILLERTPQDSKGTSYQIREMISRGFENYFTTGKLVFRKVG